MESSRAKRRALDRSPDSPPSPPPPAAADWSGLTEPLLRSIPPLLTTLRDLFAFRAVCRSWRSAAPLSPPSLSSQSPLILLTRFPGHSEALLDLHLRRLYTLVPPWRLPSRRSIAFSHGHLITTTPPPFQKPLLYNLLNSATIRLPRAPEPFRRAILSSPPSSPDCLILLFRTASSVLQYCRPGDSHWTLHHWSAPGRPASPACNIKDLIFLRGRLYSLNGSGQLGVVDLLPTPKLTTLEVGCMRWDTLERQWWLAESNGDLLLVSLEYGSGWTQVLQGVRVFRYDFASGERVELRSLGGRALFMGYEGFAASVDPDGRPGIRGNCVYCISARRNKWVVFSMEDQRIEVVSPDCPGLLRGEIEEPPVWVFPSLC